jgi:predicted amidohydrolase YtcJ
MSAEDFGADGLSLVVGADGLIADIGTDEEMADKYGSAKADTEIDARNKSVIPGE